MCLICNEILLRLVSSGLVSEANVEAKYQDIKKDAVKFFNEATGASYSKAQDIPREKIIELLQTMATNTTPGVVH